MICGRSQDSFFSHGLLTVPEPSVEKSFFSSIELSWHFCLIGHICVGLFRCFFNPEIMSYPSHLMLCLNYMSSSPQDINEDMGQKYLKPGNRIGLRFYLTFILILKSAPTHLSPLVFLTLPTFLGFKRRAMQTSSSAIIVLSPVPCPRTGGRLRQGQGCIALPVIKLFSKEIETLPFTRK